MARTIISRAPTLAPAYPGEVPLADLRAGRPPKWRLLLLFATLTASLLSAGLDYLFRPAHRRGDESFENKKDASRG